MAATKVNPTITPTSNCPWGTVSFPKTTESFNEVMSEEYAKQLQKNEESPIAIKISENIEKGNEGIDVANLAVDGTENDLLLAQMLQLEFDKENDEYVKALERQQKGDSKVSVSYEKYQMSHPYNREENLGEDWEEDDGIDEVDADVRKNAGEIVTKHDRLINERKNAQNVEMFPLSFKSGDIGKKDIRLPNHVYNKLKIHSSKMERNEMRVHEKQEHSTHEKALDENTRLILYKMVNNGVLDSLGGIISTGKEAVIIYAKGGRLEDTTLPVECALKVFKTTLNEFKTREKYIKEDHRFRDRFSKQNPRKIIRLWAEKEYRNLKRIQEAGLLCPDVFLLRKHILLMRFIGNDQVPAQKLKEAILTNKQGELAYEQCIHFLTTLYVKCNLIHSDFSEYNILWHDSRCYFIDVSQAVEPTHPHAYHFLLRDCHNITQFFSKFQLKHLMTEEELFQHVCGKELAETNLDKIESEENTNFERNEELLTYGIDSSDYSFDYEFNKSCMENHSKFQSQASSIGHEATSKIE